MARIRSPGFSPARSAALPGCTPPTSAGVKDCPAVANRTDKTVMEKMKLAMGPAATTAARWPNGL